MKIFFHICCAPCAIYPYYRMRKEGWEPTGYFYNPNIHPYREYRKRMDTVKEFSQRVGLDVVIRDDYDLEGFLGCIMGTGTVRCEHCYRMRLDGAGKRPGRRVFPFSRARSCTASTRGMT